MHTFYIYASWTKHCIFLSAEIITFVSGSDMMTLYVPEQAFNSWSPTQLPNIF